MSEMKPGRELDALIAEKVMKRPRAHIFCERCDSDDYYTNMCLACDTQLQYSNDTPCDGNPPYSTDLISAWEVIDKIDGQWIIKGQEKIGWEIFLSEASLREDRYEKPFTARADTAPHAICLAALKAIDSQAAPP